VLAGAGIAEADRAAFSVFVDRVGQGAGSAGSRQRGGGGRVRLAGDAAVAGTAAGAGGEWPPGGGVGGPKQCQAIEAGPVIELLRRALGVDAVPELLTTARQQSARERETSLMSAPGGRRRR